MERRRFSRRDFELTRSWSRQTSGFANRSQASYCHISSDGLLAENRDPTLTTKITASLTNAVVFAAASAIGFDEAESENVGYYFRPAPFRGPEVEYSARSTPSR